MQSQNQNHANSNSSHRVLLEQQDETLDELDMAVTRVGDMATHIHDEIQQQNQMLDDLDEDLTNVEQELGLVMGKLAKFLQTKDKWQLRIVLMLTAIVIVLFLCVVYL